MTQDHLTAVDDYIEDKLLPADAALEAVLEANRAAGLPAIDVSPAQGKLLNLFARMVGARRILEIGTLGGYSTLWMARALPADGLLVSLEFEPRHAAVATANLARAGLADRTQVRVGAALDTLPGVEADGLAPFDLVFIDADKINNTRYLAWALRLSRPGSVIIVDNVVRAGAVVDPARADASTVGSRAVFDALAAEGRLDATAIQTVGSKGWDGFAIAIVGAAA